ncbi:hypothetical protein TNCV_3001531 [Trichonephila clavipes]|nr:hypothetical protein TNCV_3001531 [Trichonephila clavipes]
MTNGVPKREIRPFSMLSATVSARISGIGNASIHRLYRSMIVKQNRNPSDDGKGPIISKLISVKRLVTL